MCCSELKSATGVANEVLISFLIFDQLTAKGPAAAQASGVDPAMAGKMAKAFADVYSKSADAATAGADFAAGGMGIQSTIGQGTKDAEKLLHEEAMRRGLHGEAAKNVMKKFDAA